MRIGIVINTSWNIYNFRMGLIRSLIKEGHEVVAMAPRDEYTPLIEKAGCKFQHISIDRNGVNPLNDLMLLFKMYRAYKLHRLDVILHYTIKPNIFGTFAAALLEIPVINNVCGLGTSFLQQNLISRIAGRLYKLAFKFPRKVYFQNKFDRDLFISKGFVKPEITQIVPGSGIDTTYFKPADIVRRKRFSFLLIARLIHDKGILEYIEAVKILKGKGINADFNLLGPKDPKHRRGISEELINHWIQQNHINYLGTTKDVRPHILAADCVVLPSYREGTPRTLLEAAAMGKPLVATDVPGCNQVVINNENGFLCKTKNAPDLARKMERVFHLRKEPEKLTEMHKKSRKIAVETFREEIVVDYYIDALNSISPNKSKDI